MRSVTAFTLLEVVVAVGLLAVGILALATLQADALATQRRVRAARELVAVVEAELARAVSAPEPGERTCTGQRAIPLEACVVVTRRCLEGAPAPCGRPATAGAYRVEVTAEDAEGRSVELVTLTAGPGPS